MIVNNAPFTTNFLERDNVEWEAMAADSSGEVCNLLRKSEKTAFVYVAEISQELKVIHLESAVIWIKLFSLF